VEEAEFVVIGGGVHGAAVAYELATAGSSVALLEAGRLAERASGGPGKRGVRANLRHSSELPLVQEALDRWPKLDTELGADVGFENVGGLSLIPSQPQLGDIAMEKAKAHIKLQRSYGIDTQLIDRSELDSLEPGIAEDACAAMYTSNEGIADQRRTTLAYAAAAAGRGATIKEDSRVERVDSSSLRAVLEDGRTVRASRSIILATNYGTNDLLERSGLPRLPMWTMVPQALMYRGPSDYAPRHLVSHISKNFSAKRLADNITMISGGMRGRWNAEQAIGEQVDSMVRDSLGIATEVLPGLAGGTLEAVHATLPETYTPDAVPYIDYLDDERQLFVATGWHGHGFAIAPAVAKHVATWLTAGHRPSQLTNFRAPHL
jgi:sarcosine oxidase subunit beta